MTVRRGIFIAALVALTVQSAVLSAPAAAAGTPVVVRSTQQGLQQWSIDGGKLMLVNGSYQDTTTYKRSLTFYFREAGNDAWNHVPIIETEVDRPLTWFSESQGETTQADALVWQKADGVYLVTAAVTSTPNEFRVLVYKFVEAGDDFPDGPGHLFKRVAEKKCPAHKCASVEDALKWAISGEQSVRK